MKPTVRLISHTQYPLETLYLLWEASRHNRNIGTAQAVANARQADAGFDKQVRDLFSQIINAGIPVAENVSFSFLLENVSIALREQLVRHRIGVHVGPRIGCDIVPDLADSTFWSQSMRILDMGRFADDKGYDTPDTIDGRICEPKWMSQEKAPARAIYEQHMAASQDAYTRLVKAGVPMEDARNVIPLGATHRISWTLNLAALKHIVGKRGCWILQLGVWEPIIKGMIEALATEIDPIFRDLIAPPCIKGGKFAGCCFMLDNGRRVAGEDEIPPCSLYLNHHADDALRVNRETPGSTWKPRPDGPGFECADETKTDRYDSMKRQYATLWGRNAETGEKLP